MSEMLTAKEMQDLLQVDRSTIYRMAEAGQLPAVKVGKQWRFPSDLVESWLNAQAAGPAPSPQPGDNSSKGDFAATLPLECVQLIQDAFAEVLGVMLIVTDLDGQPITRASNSCSLYDLLDETDNGHAICHELWRELGRVPALEPRFMPGFGGLLCARALVRMGNELKAMVIVFGVAPEAWPPAPEVTQQWAQRLNLPGDKLQDAFDTVFELTPDERKKVLVTIQRIADILAHVGNERLSLLERLASIARLSAV
jgi:excisionase family DNA binding protein